LNLAASFQAIYKIQMARYGCAVLVALLGILACVPWAVGPAAGCLVSGTLGELAMCPKVCFQIINEVVRPLQKSHEGFR
jgi:hypothetical protein